MTQSGPSRVRSGWRSGLSERAMVLRPQLQLGHESSPFQRVDQGVVDPSFPMPLRRSRCAGESVTCDRGTRLGLQNLFRKLTFSYAKQVAFSEKVIIILTEKAFCRKESP